MAGINYGRHLKEGPRGENIRFQINIEQYQKHQCLATWEWSLNQTLTSLELKTYVGKISTSSTTVNDFSFIIFMKQAK